MEVHSAIARRDGFLLYGVWMKTALIWLSHDGLVVVVRSLGEMSSSSNAIFDKNYIRWIDVEARWFLDPLG